MKGSGAGGPAQPSGPGPGAPWRTRTVDDTFDATLAEHRAITEAVREGDSETARLRMLEHHERDRDTRIRQKVRRDTGGGPRTD
ncbi:FCD domain-containing protein [Streptomyces sp. NPDC001507]|uniref:FCD domain-containing protein n=1 Tax=Streptomyces sp. NPDC001507 TaxID=3364579 RepID=UPI003695D9EF